LLAVLDDLRPAGNVWRAVTYFSLWALRLSGWMPDMGSAPKLTSGSRAVALEMLRTPVAQLSQTDWGQATAADLRRFLVRQIEAHIERRLVTAPLLEQS
jgi:DNA repair protein RecO (recombination protein O)